MLFVFICPMVGWDNKRGRRGRGEWGERIGGHGVTWALVVFGSWFLFSAHGSECFAMVWEKTIVLFSLFLWCALFSNECSNPYFTLLTILLTLLTSASMFCLCLNKTNPSICPSVPYFIHCSFSFFPVCKKSFMLDDEAWCVFRQSLFGLLLLSLTPMAHGWVSTCICVWEEWKNGKMGEWSKGRRARRQAGRKGNGKMNTNKTNGILRMGGRVCIRNYAITHGSDKSCGIIEQF